MWFITVHTPRVTGPSRPPFSILDQGGLASADGRSLSTILFLQAAPPSTEYVLPKPKDGRTPSLRARDKKKGGGGGERVSRRDGWLLFAGGAANIDPDKALERMVCCGTHPNASSCALGALRYHFRFPHHFSSGPRRMAFTSTNGAAKSRKRSPIARYEEDRGKPGQPRSTIQPHHLRARL